MEMWKDKFAVVVGGSSGIGAATVRDLNQNGVKVVSLDKNILEDETDIYYRKCDISDLNSVNEAYKWIEENFSFIHIHVQCAGVAHNANTLDTSDEATRKITDTINVNFTGNVHCIRKSIELMKKSNDYCLVVNICSAFGHQIPFPMPGNVYSSTKFAVRAFSETLRQELIVSGNTKIRVSQVSPGTVKTNVRIAGGWENMDEFYNQRPYLDAKEISSAILYLLSTPHHVNITEMIIKPVGEKF